MKKQNETRPADPVLLRGPNAGNGEVIELPPDDNPAQLKLQAFPEGDIFRYQEHPAAEEAGTFVIYDAAKKPVAFTQNPAIARLFCDAVRMVFAAVEQHKQDVAIAETAREVVAATTPPEHCAATRGAVRETEELQELDPRNPKGI